MNYQLTEISRNAKTGPIPVSTSGADTCPDSCPLKKKGCYGDSGPLAWHWRRLTEGKTGIAFAEFIARVARLPRGTLWRYAQAGDLPGIGDAINADELRELTRANKGKRGFTFSHKPVLNNAANAEAIREANAGGFTINLSANNPREADQLSALHIAPVVSIIATGTPKVSYTPEGRRIVACPAQTNKQTTCRDCALCQRADRDFIIGFYPHGHGKKHAEALAVAI